MTNKSPPLNSVLVAVQLDHQHEFQNKGKKKKIVNTLKTYKLCEIIAKSTNILPQNNISPQNTAP